MGKGRLFVQEQIQYAPERPDVGLFRHLDLGLRIGRAALRRSVNQCLRTDVVERAGLRELHNTSGIEGNVAGNAEIDQLEPSLDHEEIGRFEIKVDDSMVVNVVHALHHLVPNLHQRVQGDVLAVVLEDFVQIAVSLLHDEEQLVRFRKVATAK